MRPNSRSEPSQLQDAGADEILHVFSPAYTEQRFYSVTCDDGYSGQFVAVLQYLDTRPVSNLVEEMFDSWTIHTLNVTQDEQEEVAACFIPQGWQS